MGRVLNQTTLNQIYISDDTASNAAYYPTWVKATSGGQLHQGTQDLVFCERIKRLGYKICVDTAITCGHLDFNTDTIY